MDATRPSAAQPKIREQDLQGLKYFDQLAPLLSRLHEVGCQRDRAGNRSLHYDQYCMLILLFFFNPIVQSLRGLQQASELEKVQKKLGCPRTSLGSLSESVTVFDPEREWVFQAKDSVSKSLNNPFFGWTLKGRALATIVAGRPVWVEHKLSGAV